MSLVMIHGIGNAGSSAAQIRKEWIDALVKGGAERAQIEAAGPVAAFYGDILSAGKSGAGFGMLPSVDPKKAAFLAESAALLRSAYQTGLLKRAKAMALSPSLSAEAAFAELVEGPIPFDPRQALGLLDEVYDYLTKPGLRDAIDKRVAKVFTNDAPIIVAHSLGSLVAYRLLWARAKAGLPATKRLVTIGSPLSFPNVRKLLRDRFEFPDGLGDWRNAWDPLDPVTLFRAFPMPVGGTGKLRHARVDNRGALNHVAEGYLMTRPVASWVSEALQG